MKKIIFGSTLIICCTAFLIFMMSLEYISRGMSFFRIAIIAVLLVGFYLCIKGLREKD